MAYKAFVCSTNEDLKDHRRHVIEALRDSGIHVDPMENWTASSDEPKKFSQKRVEGCDLCVLLVAFRRGHIPEGEKLSITQMEYQRAKDLGVDIIPFLLNEDAPWKRCFDALAEDRELRRWRSELQEHKGVGFFELDPDSIKIQPALARWLQDKERPSKTKKPERDKELSADAELYLRALLKSSAYIDIRGLQVGESRAFRFPIEDLYMTLTTAGGRGQLETRADRKKTPDAAPLESRSIPLDESLRNRRLVIIGDPGSGKTTFLRRIASALCLAHLGEEREAAREHLGLEGRFPIFVRLEELSGAISKYQQAPDSGAPKTTAAARWLPYFLSKQSEDSHTGLDEAFFRRLLKGGLAFIMLDGLDEVPDRVRRARTTRLVENLAEVYGDCPIVVTSRPRAYRDEVILADFEQVRIDPLREETIQTFLERWCQALYPESPSEANEHRRELMEGLTKRPDIRRMATNPVMLTALAVVHWNERRLPEQRADLYESIIKWLARSREQRPESPTADHAVAILEELALEMQRHPKGRKTQVDRRWAAQAVAGEWREEEERRRVRQAESFLDAVELDSGIVVGRGGETRFWHLTFQEYLAARAIGGRPDEEQKQILFLDQRLYQPEWREVVLLFAGVLHQLGRRRVDSFVKAVIEGLGEDAVLPDQARCVGLLGQIQGDLEPLDYRVADPRYPQLRQAVMKIFDKEGSRRVAVEDRIEAAEALGQAGDSRLDPHREDRWVAIPAGSFLMGASKDPEESNHDPDADDDESPVHRVRLDSFRMGRYPVTVQENRKFLDAGGYQDESFWELGGFGDYQRPEGWDDQLLYPNRPVVGVSWYEAAAYCSWVGGRLPSEAEWEHAARGREVRRFPWGDQDPTPQHLNFDMNIGRPTPAGIYPQGETPHGISDLAGNVWEWVADRYARYPEGEQRNPIGPSKAGGFRVVRGGSFGSDADWARASNRNWDDPSSRSNILGFRVALPAAPTGRG